MWHTGLAVDGPFELLTFRAELPVHLNWQVVSFIRVAWPWVDKGSLREPYDRALRPTYFALVSGDDPECAIAYWGAAMTYNHPFWDAPSAADEAAEPRSGRPSQGAGR